MKEIDVEELTKTLKAEFLREQTVAAAKRLIRAMRSKNPYRALSGTIAILELTASWSDDD